MVIDNMQNHLLAQCLGGTMLALALVCAPVSANSETPPAANNVTQPITPPAGTEIIPSPPPVIDLVDERPSAVSAVWNYSTAAVGWVWNGFYNNVLYWVSPPSPGAFVNNISKDDAAKLFKFLGYAGYKLKVIDTDVGIIPGLKIKFGQVRELSEADVEYLDSKLLEWEEEGPGSYDALQRRIIKAVLAVNASTDFRATSLEIKLLPLPDVSFTMIPKKVFLGEEASTLMRAIQRVERGIRTLKEPPLPTK